MRRATRVGSFALRGNRGVAPRWGTRTFATASSGKGPASSEKDSGGYGNSYGATDKAQPQSRPDAANKSTVQKSDGHTAAGLPEEQSSKTRSTGNKGSPNGSKDSSSGPSSAMDGGTAGLNVVTKAGLSGDSSGWKGVGHGQNDSGNATGKKPTSDGKTVPRDQESTFGQPNHSVTPNSTSTKFTAAGTSGGTQGGQ
eukprot:TRINITY_DN16430_c0_g1_i1.p1 TRINITY_DN16430_c0_g1~~TRINITY_DN16430_c0_g1_i1.p1  ORF type:complete len:197 (-),score=82.41 TRINITY_DN16430_c0_g1_i1:16-606(-)